MKAGLIFLCVILAVIAAAKANDCEKEGHSFKVGESYSVPGKCMLVTCKEKGVIVGKTCHSSAVLDASQFIYHPQDNSKPYPECCESFESKEV